MDSLGKKTEQDDSKPEIAVINPWIEPTEFMDEAALLELGHAKKCEGECKRSIRLHHLDKDGLCPNCGGREVYMS